MSCLRPVRTGQRAHVLQRLQNLETVGLKQLDRALLAFQNGIVLCWTKVDDVDWPGGGYSCSREVRQVVRQRGGMPQLKLRDESRRWGRQSAAVGGREDQYGRGEQVCSLEVCSCASS